MLKVYFVHTLSNGTLVLQAIKITKLKLLEEEHFNNKPTIKRLHN